MKKNGDGMNRTCTGRAMRIEQKGKRTVREEEKNSCKTFDNMVTYLLRSNAIAYAKEVKQQ